MEVNNTPCSIEAENSVLGGLIISGDLKQQREIFEKILSLGLNEDSFYLNTSRTLFNAIQDLLLSHRPADVVTLNDFLESEGLLERVGGIAYIANLAKNTPSTANINAYASIVLEKKIRRDMISAAVQFSELGYNSGNKTIEEALALAQKQLDELRETAKPKKAKTISLQDLLDKDYADVKWAVPDLIPEGVSMLASKPKMGKSFMIMDICLAIGSGGKALNSIQCEKGHALYISLEDTERRLKNRTKLLGVDGASDVHFATQWRKLEDGGIKDIEAYIKERPDTKVVVIDTLEKVRNRNKAGGDGYAEDSAIGFMLTELTKKHAGLALVVVHHLRKADSEDPLDLITGTMGLTGSVDGILVLKRSRGQGDAELYVTGKDIEKEGSYALSFDAKEAGGAKVHWTLLGDAEEYRYTDSQQQIIDVIKTEGAQTIKEIADKCEMYIDSANPYQAAKKQLYRMMKDDALRRSGSKYELVESVGSDYKNISHGLSIVK